MQLVQTSLSKYRLWPLLACFATWLLGLGCLPILSFRPWIAGLKSGCYQSALTLNYPKVSWLSSDRIAASNRWDWIRQAGPSPNSDLFKEAHRCWRLNWSHGIWALPPHRQELAHDDLTGFEGQRASWLHHHLQIDDHLTFLQTCLPRCAVCLSYSLDSEKLTCKPFKTGDLDSVCLGSFGSGIVRSGSVWVGHWPWTSTASPAQCWPRFHP